MRALAQPRRAAARAATLLALVSCAAACSQIILGGTGMAYPTEAMSARTFDFRAPQRLSFEVVAVPPNFQLTGVPGTPEEKDFPLKTKYGIVCQVVNTQTVRDALASYVGKNSVKNKYGGLCFDGMNEAGLSGAYLWDNANRGYSNMTAPPMLSTADPAASNESISYFDFPLRVLAECDTTACARALTQRLAIVDRPILLNISQSMVEADFIPLHATFCDKETKCIVVEWGPGGGGIISDLPHGVMTNSPPLPAQEAYLAAYDEASLATYGADLTALDWPGGLGSTNLTVVESEEIDSITRYIRAVRLRRLFGPAAYLDSGTDLSPATYGSNYAAFAQINAVIDHLKIAGAHPGGFEAWWEGENTVVTSVRDHMKGDYYLRIASNMNSHRFNVKSLARGSRIKLKTVASVVKQRNYAIDAKF